MLGQEANRALQEILGRRYVFPSERLRRAYVCFDQAGVHVTTWPVFLRLAFQRLTRDLAGVAPDFRGLTDARVQEFLSRFAQFAALFDLEQAGTLSPEASDLLRISPYPPVRTATLPARRTEISPKAEALSHRVVI